MAENTNKSDGKPKREKPYKIAVSFKDAIQKIVTAPKPMHKKK